MKLDNTNITEVFLGDPPVKTIYLGDDLAWSHIYDYQISNIELLYSNGGTYVKCDGSNYMYIKCTLSKYKNSSLVSSSTKYMRANFMLNMGKYLTNDGTNRFYFNLKDYGTEDMSNITNPMTIGVEPYLYGISSTTLYMQLEPNVLEIVRNNGYKNDIKFYLADVFIQPYATQFSLDFSTYLLQINSYSSGLHKEVATTANSYLFDEDRSLITTGTREANNYVQPTTSNNPYPVLYTFIVSNSLTSTAYDEEFNVFQKSNNTYGENEILVLWDYHTRCFDDYYAYGSSCIKLVNDAHTSETTYDYTSTTKELTVTIQNGIIIIDGITSSMTDAQVIDITAKLGDRQKTITINVEYQ